MASVRHHDAARRLGLGAAIACAAVIAIGLSLSVLVVNLVLASRGASGLTIGLMTAVGGIATIALSPATPALLRRLGTAPALAAAIVLMSASFVAMHWLEPLWAWFVLRFLHGVGMAVVLVVAEFWINSLVPRKRRGLMLGIYAAAQSVGFALGPAIIAWIGSAGLAPFLVGAAVTLAAALPAWLGTRTLPRMEMPARLSIGTFLSSLPAAACAALAFGAVEAGMNLLPVYGLRAGHGEAVAALLATAVALGNVILQVPIGLAADALDRRKVLLACGVAALAGAAIMPLVAEQAVLLLLLLVLWGGVVAGLYSVGLARVGARYKGADLASANAAFVMLYSIGRLAGPAVTGAGMDLWDPHGFAAALALILALFVALAAYRMARHGARGPSHVAS